MAKIRGIKPEIWTDDAFVELTPYARLLWIGLWNFACDNGHLQDKSKQIKIRVLPTDDVNCAELLREIETQGLIHRADGWITIPNLPHHQKPHRRWWKTCPAPGCTPPNGQSHAQTNGCSTVDKPLVHGWSTADVDVEVDCDGDVEEKNVADRDLSAAPQQTTRTPPRPDVERLCEHLAERIKANGSRKPNITKAWRESARLLIDRDKRTEDEIHRAIDWCQNDDFWKANVLSMPTLRRQYDRLRLAASRSTPNQTRLQEHLELARKLDTLDNTYQPKELK